MNKKLAKELKKIAGIDQAMRKKAAKSGEFDVSIDKTNTKRLKEIILKHGWPTISMVGKEGSFNAWLIAQHADHDLVFQSRILVLLKKIYKDKKDINPSNIAFLEDRILMAQKKKQIFGTQFYFNKEGQFVPWPIRKNKHLNGLRKKFNLPPLEEYLESARKIKKIDK